MKKITTFTFASAIAFGSFALLLRNDAHASYMPPSEDIKIGDVCIYSNIEKEDYYDNDEKIWKKKDHICEGEVKGVSYDEKTNILTLENYKGGEKLNAGNHQELVIRLIGENKLSGIDATWMDDDKDFAITGPGSLTLENGIHDETGVNFYGSLVLDGVTLKITNGGIHFNYIKIKNSNINIESNYKKDDTNYYFIGLLACKGLIVDNSNIYIKSAVPVLAWGRAENKNDSVKPITLNSAKLDEGLRILTKKHEMNELITVATIGNADTKSSEKESDTELVGESHFQNYPTSIKIIADTDDDLEEESSDILEGANQEMNKKEEKDLVIRYNRDLNLFEKVVIDGKRLSEDNYTLASGSTVLTIKADYIKNLQAGEHTVAAYFEGDEEPIKTALTITVKSANTGIFTGSDSITIAYLISLPVLASVFYLVKGLRKRAKSRVSFNH